MLSKKMLLPLLSVLGLANCGDEQSSAREMLGTWRGNLPGMTLTIQVTNQLPDSSGAHVFQGVISSTNAGCLRTAMLTGTLTNSTVQMLGIGSGTASTATAVEISGELSGDRITGQVAVDGDDGVPGCEIAKTAAVFAR